MCGVLLAVGAGLVQAAAQVPDGVKAATAFSGSDIGAKINTAFAACGKTPCTVFVPAGDYHLKTTIVIPGGSSFSLHMDNGAFLHYDGDGWAISTSLQAARTFIRGGHILGNPAAKAGIILMPETQGIYIDEVDVKNFSQGDGILNIGANVVKITNVQVRDNMYGVHLMGSPGYASNSVTVSGSTIVGNSRWGIIDGDITQFPVPNWMGTGRGPGTTTPELANAFINNDLELNGRDPSGKYGAVLEVLTYKSLYSGNYFEASPHNIQLGCQSSPPDPVYQRLYGAKGQGCGTAVSATIRDNYFTSGAAIDVELQASVDAVIDGNAQLGGASNCFASVVGTAVGTTVSGNHIQGSAKANQNRGEWMYCRGSGATLTEGWPNQNSVATDLNIRSSTVYFNDQGPGKGSGQQMIRYTPNGPPLGFCTPAWSPGAIWMNTTTGAMYVCQSDSIAPHGGFGNNAGDGHGTWVAK